MKWAVSIAKNNKAIHLSQVDIRSAICATACSLFFVWLIACMQLLFIAGRWYQDNLYSAQIWDYFEPVLPATRRHALQGNAKRGQNGQCALRWPLQSRWQWQDDAVLAQHESGLEQFCVPTTGAQQRVRHQVPTEFACRCFVRTSMLQWKVKCLDLITLICWSSAVNLKTKALLTQQEVCKVISLNSLYFVILLWTQWLLKTSYKNHWTDLKCLVWHK